MKSACVYCGSSAGTSQSIIREATRLGELLAANNIRLVYGGGSAGLMGMVARAVLANGGNVVGIIPTFLHKKEVALIECTELIEVSSMHARKTLMIDESDALIALPGGLGTMDELFEALTWLQLGLHSLPIYLVNVDGFYNALLELLFNMKTQGFVSQQTLELLCVVETVSDIPGL